MIAAQMIYAARCARCGKWRKRAWEARYEVMDCPYWCGLACEAPLPHVAPDAWVDSEMPPQDMGDAAYIRNGVERGVARFPAAPSAPPSSITACPERGAARRA